MSLLRHIGLYLSAIYDGWVALVSGVAGVVLLVLLVFWGDDYLFLRDNKKTFVWTAFICLMVAGFSAWRKERQKWERLGGLATLSMRPKDLVSVFNQRTTTQGEQLAKSYRGKWIKISGAISDVSVESTLDSVIAPHRAAMVNFKRDIYTEPQILMWFSRKWVGSLSVLRKDDNVTVLGQIQRVERNSIWLIKCELVKVHIPTEKE
ncbi:MAG: hypothetical protein QOD28_3549 [Acidobacteriota bacterium]|nr:hypothetical protein [Acidobacteriota bacterium]